jgi:hypothetical protein
LLLGLEPCDFHLQFRQFCVRHSLKIAGPCPSALHLDLSHILIIRCVTL